MIFFRESRRNLCVWWKCSILSDLSAVRYSGSPVDVQERWTDFSRRGLESFKEDRYVRMYCRLSVYTEGLSTAEGNPDEEKIGAFGVGVSSLLITVSFCGLMSS